MKDQKVMNAVASKHRFVEAAAKEHGYQYVLMTTLVGSQNYGLETPESDVDTYSYVLPSYMNFIRGVKPLSKEFNFTDGSKACVKDLRLAFDLLRKPSPNSIECFLSDYKIYDDAFASIFEEYLLNDATLYYLTHANVKNMVDATIGTIAGLNGRNMSDGKKLAHAMRLQATLKKYLDPRISPFSYLLLQGEELTEARKAKIEMLDDKYCSQKYAEIRDVVIASLADYRKNNYEYDKAAENLANYSIDEFEYKLFDVYFALNGLRRM